MDMDNDTFEFDLYALTEVAGLQFYDYFEEDEIIGTVIPQAKDPISLMRRPDNQADSNAIEVWWRNRFHLGHIPREYASQIAPLMDSGKDIRGYVLDAGNGRSWSMEIILIGKAVEPLHNQRLGREAREAWYELEKPDFKYESRKRMAAQKFIEDLERAKYREVLEAFFEQIPKICPSDQLVNVSKKFRKTLFKWWDEVPAGLATKTQLKKWGLKPKKRQKPFAKIGYVARRDYKEYDLYKVKDCTTLKPLSKKQAIAIELEKLEFPF